jgi:hypothetical protein
MQSSIDNKKYATDTRSLIDVITQDKLMDIFIESPISKRLSIKDICIYKPGDLNKIGREGKTSWDSFSYTLQMAHNVWLHIYAVQEANRQYDNSLSPNMLLSSTSNKKEFRLYDRKFFKDIINDIFSTSDRGKAENLIEHYNRYWMSIIGTRGTIGKKAVNSSSMFNSLFETEESILVDNEDNDLQTKALEDLENSVEE